MKNKTIRLHIDVRSVETEDKRVVIDKFNSIFRNALSDPKYKDLRAGSFHCDEEKKEEVEKEIIEEKEIILPPTRFKVNQIVKTGPDMWRIISITDPGIIEVASTGPDKIGSIGSYLDVGNRYKIFRHKTDYWEMWEVVPEQMKRQTSQILMGWFNNEDEPYIDLDF